VVLLTCVCVCVCVCVCFRLCVIAINARPADVDVVSSLATRFVKDQCKFVHFEKDAHDEVHTRLRSLLPPTQSSQPSLLVLNRKRQKYTVLNGEMDEAHARTFLESVLSGSGTWTSTGTAL
jgi:hypothetical protein